MVFDYIYPFWLSSMECVKCGDLSNLLKASNQIGAFFARLVFYRCYWYWRKAIEYMQSTRNRCKMPWKCNLVSYRYFLLSRAHIVRKEYWFLFKYYFCSGISIWLVVELFFVLILRNLCCVFFLHSPPQSVDRNYRNFCCCTRIVRTHK